MLLFAVHLLLTICNQSETNAKAIQHTWYDDICSSEEFYDSIMHACLSCMNLCFKGINAAAQCQHVCPEFYKTFNSKISLTVDSRKSKLSTASGEEETNPEYNRYSTSDVVLTTEGGVDSISTASHEEETNPKYYGYSTSNIRFTTEGGADGIPAVSGEGGTNIVIVISIVVCLHVIALTVALGYVIWVRCQEKYAKHTGNLIEVCQSTKPHCSTQPDIESSHLTEVCNSTEPHCSSEPSHSNELNHLAEFSHSGSHHPTEAFMLNQAI